MKIPIKNWNWNKKNKKRKERYDITLVQFEILFDLGLLVLLLIVWIGLVFICVPNLSQYTYVYYLDVYIAIN